MKVSKKVVKNLKCKENGRSSDQITPSFIFGCLFNCQYCVTLDTLIITPYGPKKAEEIQEGDLIISFCLEALKFEKDEVLLIAQRDTDELYVIEVNSEILNVTGEHPFYTKNRGWVEAKYLTEDDELLYGIYDLNQ